MNTIPQALRALCGSESRCRLFSALFGAAEKEYHLRGLAAAAAVDPSHVHKLLPEFIAAGLCEQVQGAPHSKYRANREHPLYARLRDLFQAGLPQTVELEDVDVKDAPALRSLLWTGKERSRIPAREAFRAYERNWRYLRRTPIAPAERKLIDRLAKTYGGGVING